MLKSICTCNISHRIVNSNRCWNPTGKGFIHTSEVLMKDGLFKVFLKKYASAVRRVESGFQKLAPRPMKVYHRLKGGMVEFYKELREVIELRKKQMETNDYDSLDLNLHQLTINYQLNRHIIRLFPLMVLSILPFTVFFIVPLCYYFPHVFLTRHFQTEKQKEDAAYLRLKKRLYHAEIVYEYLQKYTESLRHPDCKELMNCLDNGIIPEMSLIMKCSSLFHRGQSLSIEALPSAYTNRLGFMNGIYVDVDSKRLLTFGRFIEACDRAILRDKPELSADEVKELLLLRGFNALNVSTGEAREELKTWLNLSQHITAYNYSLLFHAPILLWRNHPAQHIQEQVS